MNSATVSLHTLHSVLLATLSFMSYNMIIQSGSKSGGSLSSLICSVLTTDPETDTIGKWKGLKGQKGEGGIGK